ncbi:MULTISPECIES: FhaA domain-containing protein [unclassified Rathayibacter]|uniref:FhaA domain-containing protein n=1 Tax=unclassified Rathayibacter TaxID=2609250 RepID=UPI00188A4924|nr:MULTISPECIES: DUF3662 and FHA domain-containing protein [unclassified Rathayibacter]MBF4461065.1 DUF3662 and FHA domain-containing protein [Rathayibacter sp. VKM Ac-2879]MBF4502476.1 DUF3662 and FHA domain-containing protein [Rathayibacter sp. VKM Ac-2878]
MGILDNFERGLERVVNGAFARTFKSGLQPVELASALKRELDTTAAVVSRERILVPNHLVLRMSASDLDRMERLGTTLIDELTTVATEHATKQGFRFPGPVEITLALDESLGDGMVEVDSRSVKGTVVSTPVLDIDGKRYPLTASRTVIGRGSDADITVDDSGTSRKHVEILWDGTRAQVRDLGSTNGSKLDGKRVTQAPLAPEQTITIGRTSIVYRVVQGAAPARNDRPSGRAAGRSSEGFWDDRL